MSSPRRLAAHMKGSHLMPEPDAEKLLAALRSFALAETRGAVGDLVARIMDLDRTTPIVCLTARPGEHLPALDARSVHDLVGPNAKIWLVPSGVPTMQLSERLPHQLRVADGDARIYWPGVDEDSDAAHHPLVEAQRQTAADALQSFEAVWEAGPREPARVVNARRLLAEQHNVDNPTVEELCEYRYALVEHHERYDDVWVSGHPGVENARRYIEGQVPDGWSPVEIVDLDTNEVVVDEAAFIVETSVSFTGDQSIRPLLALAAQLGIGERGLNDLVHQLHENQASDINAGGPSAQLQYLVDRYQEDVAEGLIRKVAGGNGREEEGS
jgi:hypothetical protein